MNSVLDVLKLRHVRINYITPAICPPGFSGSGSSFFVLDVEGPAAPTGLRFAGQCNKFLTWTNYPDLICMSLYRAEEEGDITGPYVLLKECLAAYTAYVCSPGWWKIVLTDKDGNEVSQTEPVSSSGEAPLQIPIPRPTGATNFTLYQNLDRTNPGGTYAPVFSNELSSVFEVCAGGCYTLQAITLNGVSPLSAPLCRAALHDIADCVGNFVWDTETCDCRCDETPCQPGYHFDFDRCDCWCDEQVCAGYFRWDETLCECVCDDRACPQFQSLNVETCECDLDGCDPLATYPVVSNWDGSIKRLYGCLDRTNQRLWSVDTYNDIAAPWEITVSVVDTANAAFLAHATDTLGLINSQAKASTGNAHGESIIDTKYGTCVVFGNQGWVTWYDLATLNAVTNTWIMGANIPVLYQRIVPYDAGRGHLYIPGSNLGSLAVRVVDCAPASRTTVGYYVGDGRNSGFAAYCPDNDSLYVTESSMTHLYNKWDPISHAFTYGFGPAPTVVPGSCWYIRGIGLIAIHAGTTLYFIDPNNGDAVVGSISYAGGVRWIDYNDCNGLIYSVKNSGGTIQRIDPTSGFSQVTVPTPPGRLYDFVLFDQLSNRLYCDRQAFGDIETYV